LVPAVESGTNEEVIALQLCAAHYKLTNLFKIPLNFVVQLTVLYHSHETCLKQVLLKKRSFGAKIKVFKLRE
jgi:hypothetical protein